MKEILLPAVLISILFSASANALIAKDGKVTLEKLKDYDFCQHHDYDGSWCHQALENWVEAHPADAWEAGKMTRKVMNSWNAITFFAKAFDAKKGDCKDEDVKLAVLSALNLPASGNEEVVKAAKKIGLQTCVKELGSEIAKTAKEDAYTFDNTCKELQALKLIQLGSIQKKKCETGE